MPKGISIYNNFILFINADKAIRIQRKLMLERLHLISSHWVGRLALERLCGAVSHVRMAHKDGGIRGAAREVNLLRDQLHEINSCTINSHVINCVRDQLHQVNSCNVNSSLTRTTLWKQFRPFRMTLPTILSKGRRPGLGRPSRRSLGIKRR